MFFFVLMKVRKKIFILVWMVLLFAACAPVQETQEKRRYFWPPYSDNPKIEYILYAQTDHNVKDVWSSWLESSILGVAPPTRLFEFPQNIAAYGSKVYVTDKSTEFVKILDFEAQTIENLDVYDNESVPGRIQVNGIEVDELGHVFISDAASQRVIEYGPDGHYIKFFGREHLRRPFGLAVDRKRERVYVVEPGRHEVMVFSLDGSYLETIGQRGGDPGQFNFPLDLDVDNEGNLYVLDSLNARVQVLTPEGEFIREFGERGTATGSFRRAKSIAVSSFGHVYVTDALLNKIVIFDVDGTFLLNLGGYYKAKKGVSPGGLYFPSGIDVDAKGGIWVVDTMNRMIHKFQYLSDEYLTLNPIH